MLRLVGVRGEILHFHRLYQLSRHSGPLSRIRSGAPQQRLVAELLAKRLVVSINETSGAACRLRQCCEFVCDLIRHRDESSLCRV